MRMQLSRALALLVVALIAVACEVDTIPHGLRATPPGDGPVVKFDLTHRPLPELPLPNDVGTFADPTSRTGIRINASLVAPTGFEQRARADFATMEGWGTSAPISVAFAKQDGADPREAAIDLDDVARRMQGHDYDLSDDPLYVIDLATGRPVFLNVGNGMYPVVIRDTRQSDTLAQDRYELMRAAQIRQQPKPSSVLGINEAPTLPELDLSGRRTPLSGLVQSPATVPASTPALVSPGAL